MKVLITREHIKRGKRKSATKCALSLALCDALGLKRPGLLTATNVVVTSVSIWADLREFKPTSETRQWICDFDRGLPVQPFEAELWAQ